MGGDRSAVRLSEIAKFSYGKMPKKVLLGQGKYPTFSGYKYQYAYPEFNCEAGDVIVVARGVGGTGDVKLVREKCYLTNLAIKIELDQSRVDNRFFFYRFLNAGLRHLDSGSAQSQITINDLNNEPISLPTLSEQKTIAHILGTLDNKIELNRQMSATLEAMAQALFRSWFVDFDPVIDNALAAGNPIPEPLHAKAEARKALGDKRKPLPEAIQQQFPSRFAFSEEMGWIPEGWSLGVLSEIAELKTQSIHPNKEPDKEWTHFSIPAFDEGVWPTFDLGETIKSGKYSVPSSCILASKLNPQFPRVWMPEVEDESHSICSTEFMPFVPLNPSEREYLYSLFCSEVIQREIANRVTGSTGSRQRVKPKEIAELPIMVVPQKIREAYSSMIGPLFSKRAENKKAGITTSGIRDTLLPKLLSGELRIPDAERLVEDAV